MWSVSVVLNATACLCKILILQLDLGTEVYIVSALVAPMRSSVRVAPMRNSGMASPVAVSIPPWAAF
jgi:hypothetical protein